MAMIDEQDMVNRLMQSLSSIDDDLLLDVEPAKRGNIVSMPVNHVDGIPTSERSHTTRHVPADREHVRVRDKYKRKSSRKVWVAVASIAACLIVVFGVLYVWQAGLNGAVKDAARDYSNEHAKAPKALDGSFDQTSFEVVMSPDDQVSFDRAFVKVIEALSVPSLEASANVENEKEVVLSRVITRLADQSAYQVLASSERNAVYSPLNLYQTVALLAESVENDRRAPFDPLLVDNASGDTMTIFSPYYVLTEECTAQSAVLMGAHLYELCDQPLLTSISNRFFYDVYTWNDGTDRSASAVSPHFATAIEWNPLNELLFMFQYDADVTWTKSMSSVALREGLFHTPQDTLTGVSFFDSDDASLRHWELDGAIACELPVVGGNLYLVLPDEGLRPDDLLEQDSFFTRFLTAEPAGQNAVARFPALNVCDQRNLVGVSGVEELRKLIEAPVRLQWLKGEDVSIPLFEQDINFSLDGPVHQTDERGPDAVDRMSLEAIFDRPFIFCLTEKTYNIPILIGVCRYPDR